MKKVSQIPIISGQLFNLTSLIINIRSPEKNECAVFHQLSLINTALFFAIVNLRPKSIYIETLCICICVVVAGDVACPDHYPHSGVWVAGVFRGWGAGSICRTGAYELYGF
jgi:hypothetical protein